MPDPASTPSTELAPAPARAPVRLGLAPTTIEEGWRLAQMMAKSDLVPKNFRGKPEDVIVAIQMGAEIGFAPMQALQSIAVINGRPGVWGDGFLALIMRSPLYADHEECFEVAGQKRDGLVVEDWKADTTAAVCTFVRKGKAMPVTRRFTVAQARKAQLLGKEGPWQTYPDRMLAMRARAFAGRDAFPDVLRGIGSAEELGDIVSDVPPPRIVRRLSDPPATVPPFAPGPAVETLGPLAVVRVEPTVAGYAAILSDDTAVNCDEAAAIELEKFTDTDHVLRLTCDRLEGGWRLVGFEVAS